MEVESKITGKTYIPFEAIYVSNMLQARLYLIHLGPDGLLDILYNSDKRPDSLVFVFAKGEKTRSLKQRWDNHTLTDQVDMSLL